MKQCASSSAPGRPPSLPFATANAHLQQRSRARARALQAGRFETPEKLNLP